MWLSGASQREPETWLCREMRLFLWRHVGQFMFSMWPFTWRGIDSRRIILSRIVLNKLYSGQIDDCIWRIEKNFIEISLLLLDVSCNMLDEFGQKFHRNSFHFRYWRWTMRIENNFSSDFRQNFEDWEKKSK